MFGGYDGTDYIVGLCTIPGCKNGISSRFSVGVYRRMAICEQCFQSAYSEVNDDTWAFLKKHKEE